MTQLEKARDYDRLNAELEKYKKALDIALSVVTAKIICRCCVRCERDAQKSYDSITEILGGKK